MKDTGRPAEICLGGSYFSFLMYLIFLLSLRLSLLRSFVVVVGLVGTTKAIVDVGGTDNETAVKMFCSGFPKECYQRYRVLMLARCK